MDTIKQGKPIYIPAGQPLAREVMTDAAGDGGRRRRMGAWVLRALRRELFDGPEASSSGVMSR